MFLLRIIAIAFLWASASSSADEIQSWRDAEGRLHFSNVASAGDTGEVPVAAEASEGSVTMAVEKSSARRFAEEADSLINSLELDIRRKKRAVRREKQDLETVRRRQYELRELESGRRGDPSRKIEIEKLKLEEAEHVSTISSLGQQISELEDEISGLRSVKLDSRTKLDEGGLEDFSGN